MLMDTLQAVAVALVLGALMLVLMWFDARIRARINERERELVEERGSR